MSARLRQVAALPAAPKLAGNELQIAQGTRPALVTLEEPLDPLPPPAPPAPPAPTG